jgi:ornithine carbamoyltransferase
MVFTGRRYEIINDADEMDYPPQELYDLLYINENKKQDNNKNNKFISKIT